MSAATTSPAAPPAATGSRTLLAPSAQAIPPAASPATAMGPTPRTFLAGLAQILLVPLLGLAALLTVWSLTSGTGWPVATAAVAGWSLAVAAWLRHRGWPAATLHLVAWAAPAALLAPLAGLGWLSSDGLVLWGPVSAALAGALAAAHDPGLVSLPRRARRA